MNNIKDNIILICGLFSSLSTIFCCALPVVLVFFGLGSLFAAISAKFMFINWLVENNLYLFLASFLFLSISGYFIFIKKQNCKTDKKLLQACQISKKINKIIWIIATLILLISLFFKYILIMFIG